jgi:hypothetical protein
MTEYIPRYPSTPIGPGSDVGEPLAGTAGAPLPAEPADPIRRSSGGESGTIDVARDQASDVTEGAVEASQHVAGIAKSQVSNVAEETGRQAKDLLEQARTELTAQAGRQQQRIADGLRALADELHSMTQHGGHSGVATELADQGGQKSKDIASWLDEREPGRLIEEVKTFARQRPGAFLLLATGLGLAAGRLTRGLTDVASGDGAATGDAASARMPEVVPASTGFAAAGPVVVTQDLDVGRPYASSEDSPAGFPTRGGTL